MGERALIGDKLLAGWAESCFMQRHFFKKSAT
jgi:hypothetical protein